MSQISAPSVFRVGLSQLNNSRLFTGIVMIIMNVGGKYVSKDIPKNADKIFSHWIMRIAIVFCISFAATHDIITSSYITAFFFIIFKILINEEHILCVVPKNIIELDQNDDGRVTMDELIRAQKIVDNYKSKLSGIQSTFI